MSHVFCQKKIDPKHLLRTSHVFCQKDDPCDPDEGEMDIFEMVDGGGLAEATYHWQTNWPNQTCAYPDGHEEV
jgi:hypothetical protein